MIRFCIICGKLLSGKQRKLCSDECRRERKKERMYEWCQNNREKINGYSRKYRQDNPEKAKESSRRSYQNNREKKIRFCTICGKELIDKQKILCSDKECHRKRKKDYDHNYHQDNRKKKKEYRRNYYQDNREEYLKNVHEYQQNNLEKIKRRKREYRQNNREKVRNRNREYRQNNLEKVRKYRRKQYRLERGLPEDADLRKESSIERITREWLQKNNIEFIAQYYINLEGTSHTKVDFYILKANVCLYCDGDYYHLLPNAKRCDEEQNRILPQMGYDVIRITETEILEGNAVWCRLAQYLGIDENEKDYAG